MRKRERCHRSRSHLRPSDTARKLLGPRPVTAAAAVAAGPPVLAVAANFFSDGGSSLSFSLPVFLPLSHSLPFSLSASLSHSYSLSLSLILSVSLSLILTLSFSPLLPRSTTVSKLSCGAIRRADGVREMKREGERLSLSLSSSPFKREEGGESGSLFLSFSLSFRKIR